MAISGLPKTRFHAHKKVVMEKNNQLFYQLSKYKLFIGDESFVFETRAFFVSRLLQ